MILLLILLLACPTLLWAQATSQTAFVVACPADGSSIEVLPANAKRYGFILKNNNTANIRIGYLASGTADLDSTNSIQLAYQQSMNNSYPSVFSGRIVCMSTTAGALDLEVTELRR